MNQFEPSVIEELNFYIKNHYELQDLQDGRDMGHLLTFIKDNESVKGNILELGIYKGGTTIMIAHFLKKIKLDYYFWIILLGIGTYIILRYFRDDMGLMVKIATILSFLTAPFYAILNFILITGKHTPKDQHPSTYLKILSVGGIIFLIVFSIWFLFSL